MVHQDSEAEVMKEDERFTGWCFVRRQETDYDSIHRNGGLGLRENRMDFRMGLHHLQAHSYHYYCSYVCHHSASILRPSRRLSMQNVICDSLWIWRQCV